MLKRCKRSGTLQFKDLGTNTKHNVDYKQARELTELTPTLNPPILRIDDPLLEKTYNAIFEQLRKNLRPPSGYLKGRYAIPGGKYQRSWFWDTAFISQVWLLANPDIAKEIILTHIGTQLEDGMIPHMVSPDYKSSITQPPLFAWATWKIYEKTKDEDFILKVYPKLKLFIQWIISSRDFHGDGLYKWVRSDESGMDDSPRFDGIMVTQAPEYFPHPDLLTRSLHSWALHLLGKLRFGIHPQIGKLDIRDIRALDLNCFLVNELSYLAKIADILRLESDRESFKKRATDLSELIQRKLWSDEDSFFYDLGPSGFIKVKTPVAFYTLFSGVADENQSIRLVEHLTDENEFWTPYPVPSVAVNDKRFLLKYWRGPVWINVNYLIYLGLRSYGFDDIAYELRDKTIQMVANVYDKRGNFYEFYNPFTGDVEGFLPPKPAKEFVGWTGLIANLLYDKYSL